MTTPDRNSNREASRDENRIDPKIRAHVEAGVDSSDIKPDVDFDPADWPDAIAQPLPAPEPADPERLEQMRRRLHRRTGQDRDLEVLEVADLLDATETAVRTGGGTGEDAAVTWIETRRILDRYRAGQVRAEHALDLIETWHQHDEPQPPRAYDDSDGPF